MSVEPLCPKTAPFAADVLGDASARNEVEAMLRATFDRAPVGMALVDVNGRLLRVNAKFCDMLGYSPADLERLTFQDITHADDIAENLVLLRRALAGEIDTYDIEKRYIRKDGALIWAHIAASLVRDERGEPQYLISVIEDVTERKRAQEALRESEQRLSVALDAGQLGSWQFDVVNRALAASAEFKANFGLSPEAALTCEILLSRVHPEDRERRRAAVAQAIATGADYHMEYRNLWPDGSIHWIMARGRVIHDRGGKPLRLVGVALDTTERHRAEDELRRLNDTLEQRVRQRTRQLESEIERRERAREALRASEARYAAVFQHTSAGIILLSVMPDGRFVYDAVNPTHERFSGMAAAAYAGVTSYDLFPRELADRLVARYRRCVETEAPLTYEDTYPYRAGTRVLQATVVPIRDGAGKISTLLISTHDVTQHKQTEEALRQGQKMEAVGQLTGGVAHDFNNLLTAVLGNLELLGHRVDDPRSRKLVEGAMRAAERGAKLTQQLLAFARKQRLEPKPADLNRLIVGMVDMLLSTIGATVRIETVLGEGLWPAMLDANQIELVLLNLAINARDAMPKGGVLTITAENLRVGPRQRPADLAPGDYVVLSVADTGTGMSEEVRARAFEPFFTTKAVGKGSGLGLSQVYGIARQLGGGVDIESRPGAGATVRVYLPRACEAALEPGAEPAASAVAAQHAARILVVDDDGYVREFVASCLDSFGYEVVTAPDASAALEIIAGGDTIDLLLVDFAMPEINGIELVRRAKQQRPWLNVLFMTGYAHTAALDREMAGVSVMRKPFKLGDLAAAVRKTLRHPAKGQAKILPLRRTLRD